MKPIDNFPEDIQILGRLYIEVLHKPSYGNVYYEPLSKDALFLCKIYKKKVLTQAQLASMASYGWHILIQRESLDSIISPQRKYE